MPNARTLCVRCGVVRADFRTICPACGHRPEGEGQLIPWLLSENHLDEAEFEATAQRIKDGELVQPSRRMLDQARRALGTHYASDPGLSANEALGLFAGIVCCFEGLRTSGDATEIPKAVSRAMLRAVTVAVFIWGAIVIAVYV